MSQIILFITSSLKEISPWHNIRTLNTNIRGDILSGITVGIIALPLALAFGEISQLGPIAGVWGAIAGGVVGGLFGGCLVGVSGPTAPKAAQIAAFMSFFVIGSTNNPDLVAAFSIIFISGLILVCISLLKISRFIHYTPYPVVAGFMCGIGVIVILTQMNAFLGLEAEKNVHDVFNNFRYNLQRINIEALYVAIPSLLILFIWRPLEKKINFFANVPAPLVALIIGTSIAYILNLNIPYIGDKMGSSQESKIFTFYIPNLTRIGDFIGPALSLAGLAVLDSLLSCIVADNMIGTRHSSDRETFGQGMANMAAGLLGGVTTATATMRTVANIKFGGKTPLASIVHGLTLLAILLGLGSLVAIIPTACLAAILFKVGIDILDYRILPILRKIPKMDLFIFFIVLFTTVYKDLMVAVFIGIVFACLWSAKKIIESFKLIDKYQISTFSQSSFAQENLNKQELEQLPVSVLQPKGPLFFGSVMPLAEIYLSLPEHELLIIDMSDITMIDLSGVFALQDLVKNSTSNGIDVCVSSAAPYIKKILDKVDFIDRVKNVHYLDSKSSVSSFVLENYQQK